MTTAGGSGDDEHDDGRNHPGTMYFEFQPPRVRTICAGTQIPASTSPKNSYASGSGTPRNGSMKRAPRTAAATMPIPTRIAATMAGRAFRTQAEPDDRPSESPRSCRRARTTSAIASMSVR